MFNVTSVCWLPLWRALPPQFQSSPSQISHPLSVPFIHRGGPLLCVCQRESLCMYLYRCIHYHSMKCICNVIVCKILVGCWFHQEHLFHWNLLFYLGSGCVCLCWPWIASGTVRRLLMGFLMAIVMKKFPGYCSAPWEMYWQRRYSTQVWTVYTCATPSLPPIGVLCTHKVDLIKLFSINHVCFSLLVQSLVTVWIYNTVCHSLEYLIQS